MKFSKARTLDPMNRRLCTLIFVTTLAVSRHMGGGELVPPPDFTTCRDNLAIDAFLRQASHTYATMARTVELRGGYRIEDKNGVKGGQWNGGERAIQLNPQLVGAHRASIIAFELTNAYHQPLFTENDLAAISGEIETKMEFGLLQEVIEYDSVRLHRDVLIEIEMQLGKIPPAFFYCSLEPKPDSVASYKLPMISIHLKRMKALGHTASYYQWFETHAMKNRGHQSKSNKSMQIDASPAP